jgi:uncharacterized DUF497 family protein
MQVSAFEWDDAKAASNWRDHGVTFEMARVACLDYFAIEWADDGQDTREERFSLLGMVGDRLLFVAYTMRGDRTRIITARKAEPYECRKYYDANREP